MRRRSGRRSFHRLTGLVGALGLIVLTATGVGLLHPEWFGRGADSPAVVAADPFVSSRLLRAAPFYLEESRDGGATWRELPFQMAPARPVALAFATRDSGTVWLLGTIELMVSRDGGAIWEPVNLPGAVSFDEPARDLALPAAGEPLVATDYHGWRRGTGAAGWRELWHHPPTGADRVRTWMRRLHNGHWGPVFVGRVYDIVAVVALLAVLSGVVLLWRRNGRNGNGHNS